MATSPQPRRPSTSVAWEAVDKRIALFSPVDLPPNVKEMIALVKFYTRECAREIQTSIETSDLKCDTERLIAGLDFLRQCKKSITEALKLPYMTAEKAESSK